MTTQTMYEQVLATSSGMALSDIFRGRTCKVEQCYAPVNGSRIMCAKCEAEYEKGVIWLSYKHGFDGTVSIRGRK